ncbi:MAG: uroporphyrinogen-III C-methyltransferase [Eggerthellaceae bacterium]|nr:uroporphyrinogen-III C-methyltransferase [Eggerthellaceae bacterium]
MSTANDSLVYLIGAGPGDPGLLTCRAREVLQAADVVIYDYLASDAVMRFANRQAKRIFVGKKGFSAHVTQEEINACIIQEARVPGLVIARLKGGDPFVFGRGGEEGLALREAGIPFKVVPGVTAGVAAPAYAGIPVTHRRVATSVTLVTGHETPEKNESGINWEFLAKGGDTLCFYMGIRDLPTIVRKLIEGGRAADTPVALVRWGTTPRQETLVATLETVVDKVREAQFKAPAIIVVGDVVSLRNDLSWFEDAPLFGKTVVVTRSREQASALSGRLNVLGADVVEFPTIEIAPRAMDDELTSAIAELSAGAFDWVVFTSANGVSCFFDMLCAQGCDARAFAGSKIAAIGPATAQALKARGLHADLVPPRFVAESVVASLSEACDLSAASILIPRASAARDVLPASLSEAGATVRVVPVYDTVMPHDEEAGDLVERLRSGEVSAVTFTSSSTARNFASMVRDACEPCEWPALLSGVQLASIGPITSNTMRKEGMEPTCEAPTYTIPALAHLVEDVLSNEKENN